MYIYIYNVYLYIYILRSSPITICEQMLNGINPDHRRWPFFALAPWTGKIQSFVQRCDSEQMEIWELRSESPIW